MAPIGLCLALATAAETHCRMAETCSKENERATRRGCSNNGLHARRPTPTTRPTFLVRARPVVSTIVANVSFPALVWCRIALRCS